MNKITEGNECAKKIEPVRAFAVLTTRKSNEKYNEKEMENELKEIISSQLEKKT